MRFEKLGKESKFLFDGISFVNNLILNEVKEICQPHWWNPLNLAETLSAEPQDEGLFLRTHEKIRYKLKYFKKLNEKSVAEAASVAEAGTQNEAFQRMMQTFFLNHVQTNSSPPHHPAVYANLNPLAAQKNRKKKSRKRSSSSTSTQESFKKAKDQKLTLM